MTTTHAPARRWFARILSLLTLTTLGLSTGLGVAAAAPTVPVLAPGASLGLELGLTAAHNLRDLGGYQTVDGRTVVHGKVYRSDQFNPMNDADKAKLATTPIRTVFDLRTVAERDAAPDELPAGWQHRPINVLADEASAMAAEAGAIMHDPAKLTAEFGRPGLIDEIFEQTYRQLVYLPSALQGFGDLYRALGDPAQQAGVFHCATGKDRTGWAAAALLTLLGVPRETVYADYLRSNEYLLPYYAPMIDKFVAAGGSRDLITTFLDVRTPWLDAAFDEMTKRYGTIENYFATGLGIDAGQQAALKDQLLR